MENGHKAGFFDGVRRVPVDLVAARVIGSGIRHTPYGKAVSELVSHFEVCPPLRTAAWLKFNLETPDLTGSRFGRLTVIGLARDIRGSAGTGGRWVVRCACGDYEVRTAKAIKNPANADDMCRVCGKAKETKRFRDYIERGGVSPKGSQMCKVKE